MSSLELHSSHKPKDELYLRKELALQNLEVWMMQEREKLEVMPAPTFTHKDMGQRIRSKNGMHSASEEYRALMNSNRWKKKKAKVTLTGRAITSTCGLASDSKEYNSEMQRRRRTKLKKEGKPIT